ncbi:thiamine phosphate synthase [Clostridium niameyense]|uniref:Thiamine phosphate synthase n=1 Tax=Clostridium niameyense TaxID=1622073 RepID=A0A6M0RAR6_9CLOT|nr:thiamine phosphate synthase [Clostridium niameyense]NEZ46837.1 thiamine phosphate synthase [Clostridium niameyense]
MIVAVTSRKLTERGNLYIIVEQALKSGAGAIMLREKDLDFKSLYPIALQLKKITEKYNAEFIVNGNFKIAKKVKANYYHTSFLNLKKIDQPLNFNTGVSIHSLEEGIEAERLGAKYILVGNIYETNCKPGLKGKGENFLKKIISSINIPVIAIGGINENNIKSIKEVGAYGAAVMSLAMKTPENIKKLL